MRLVLLLVCFCVSIGASAGKGDGIITDVTLRAQDNIMLIRMDNYQSLADCVSWEHPFGMRYDSDVAKALYSMFLSAKATGERVRVVGTGECSRGTSGFEFIQEANIGPWGK
ncbi:hypothetical protein [Vibrio penaeicida]|uniref:hypothetical protein n=1 Tax=Vibrio penaeicida TaxID=104609 RepID=UPI0011AB6593|nr:hypothetical protein [Vibrio penaeicida]